MRFKSAVVNGFQAFAVSGTNTVSFAITATASARKGLLGFIVERSDPAEGERYVLPGFKVFRSLIPHPDQNTMPSTHDHPVQSFVWDDFTGKPGREYEYFFRPFRGKPKAPDRTAKQIRIRVKTEELWSDNEHDIFFNRGVASSQAYRRKFGNKPPDEQPTEEKKKAAFEWLTRDLDEAMLRFIGEAKKNDTLLGCFYEFRYREVADALRSAIDRGVDVQLIVDGKVNEHTDKKGKFHPSFPRVDNLDMLDEAGIDLDRVVLRDRNTNDIQHNKFMVLLKGKKKTPKAVWTGSTNLSVGGLSGQTNVGHWVRNDAVAASFRDYWDLLAANPGSAKNDDLATAKKKKKKLRDAVAALAPTPATLAEIPPGITTVFSPRSGLEVLELYVRLVDESSTAAAVTLAFGINELFKEQLKDNTDQSGIVFLLLEKKDKPNPNSQKPFVKINASNNVYKAWGSYLRDPVYQWARETNAKQLELNKHVSYIHSKFLLMDPLGDDPIVVTGSANFSAASTNSNDENMLIIRGDRRVADIYFTEFNRLFNHYYFRSVYESTRNDDAAAGSELFLDETGKEWVKKYGPGKLRTKRVAIYAKMKGFTSL